jgi:hypothetical protein
VPEALRAWPAAWLLLPAVCLAQICLVPILFFIQSGIPPRYSAFLFLGNLALIWVFLVILKRIVCRDALQWRGTTYPENRYEPTNLNPATSGAFSRPPAWKEAN